MILLSNCLTDTADEGVLKVANSLAKRIKQADERVTILSFRRRSQLTDIYMEVNKMMVSPELVQLVRKKKEPIIYIPFPTRASSMALRILWLSWFSPERIKVVLTMMNGHNWASKLMLKLSRSDLFVLSQNMADFYTKFLKKQRVTYLRTGVDTKRFVPVSAERTMELKRKYGLDPHKKVVLHVGHLKRGRNIIQLMKVDEEYQVLLVVSTFTKESRDDELKKQLESCNNIRILDGYLPNIEEVYQLSDVYIFPVTEPGNCIDVPLSCLEAAACGKPVITTDYGENSQLMDKDGFYRIEKMDREEINRLIYNAITDVGKNPREAVLPYDWSNGVALLLEK